MEKAVLPFAFLTGNPTRPHEVPFALSDPEGLALVHTASNPAMADLVREGKIRFAGVSNFSQEQLEALRPILPPASLQPPYSLLERGVEAETLACGTGAVASAALLHEWGLAGQVVRLGTKSGRTLVVTLRRKADGHIWPSLSGEARIVYQGRTAEL